MKSSFDKKELSKLNSILFQKKSEIKKVNKSITIVENKENVEIIQNSNSNLHEQMQTLKREVQTMLDQNHNEAVEKVIRSTTRHYLEKIKNLSVELPQTLDGFKQAAETFIQSLPMRKRPLMGTQRCIRIQMRFGFKLLFRSLRPRVLQLYKQFFKRTIKMVNRKDRTNLNVFIQSTQKRILSKYFYEWKYVRTQEKLKYKNQEVIQQIIDTISISESLLNQTKTILYLQKILSKEAICQILIVNGNTLYTYKQQDLQNDTFRRQRQMEDVFQSKKLSEDNEQIVQQQRFIKHIIPMKDSITSLCLKKKQMIQTNSPSSDPTFSQIDLPISSPQGPKHPLLFIPILFQNSVVAIIRFFWYPLLPSKFQLSSTMYQFVSTTLLTSLKLSKILTIFKERRYQQQKQLNFRLLKFLGSIQNQIQCSKIFQELSSILQCQKLTVISYFGQQAQLVYSLNSQPSQTKQNIIDRIENCRDNILIVESNGKTIGIAQIINSTFQYNNLNNLLKIIFQRLEYIRIKKLQQQNNKVMLCRQQSANKKLKLQRIMKVGLSQLTSFSLLNVVKVIQLLITELDLIAADILIKINDSFISGLKYLKGEIVKMSQKTKTQIKLSQIQNVQQGIVNQLGFKASNNDQNIVFYNRVIGDQIIVVCFAVQKCNKQKDMVIQTIDKLSQWLSHIIKISDTETITSLSKIVNGFKSTVMQQCELIDQKYKFFVSNDRIHKMLQRIKRFSSASSILEIPNQSISKYSQQLPLLFKNRYFYISTTNRLLPRQLIKPQQQMLLLNINLLVLNQLDITVKDQTYLHLFQAYNKTFIITIQNMKINNPVLLFKSIQKMIEFQIEISNTSEYQLVNNEFMKKQSAMNVFSTINTIIESLNKPLFQLQTSFWKNSLFYIVHKLVRNRQIVCFKRINNFNQINGNRKSLIYQNLNNIEKLFNPIKIQILQEQQEVFYTLLNITNKSKRITKSIVTLQHFMENKTNSIKVRSFYKLKSITKPLSINIMVFSKILYKKLSFAFYSIKGFTQANKNSDQSLISSLSFPLNFGLLKNIIKKSKQLSDCELMIQNQQKTHFIQFSESNRFNIRVTGEEKMNIYRVQCMGFSLLWKLKQSQTMQFKQYLQTLSKVVFENVKSYQQLIFPVFLKLNLKIKQICNRYKYKFYMKWKNIVLKSNKMKEYNNIEKAYRYNNEAKLVLEAKERKQKESKELQEEYLELKQKFQSSEKVLQHESKQIKKIDKYLAAHQLINVFTNAQKQMNKRNMCWNKWKLMMIQERERSEETHLRRLKKIQLAIKQGLKQTVRIMSQKNKQFKNMALKEFIVNSIRLSQLEEEQEQKQKLNTVKSSINSKQQQQLMIEQFDSVQASIKGFGHMRIPTFSSISNHSQTKFNNQQTKINETRYCSFGSSRKSESNRKQANLNSSLKQDQKQNKHDQNYFLPILDVKRRIINNFENSSVDNMSLQMNSQLNTGYKLSDKTLKFLKRFGKRLNTTVGDYYEGDMSKSLLDYSCKSQKQNEHSFK